MRLSKASFLVIFTALVTSICIVYFQFHIYNLVSIKETPQYKIGTSWKESLDVEKKDKTVKAYSLLKKYFGDDVVVKRFNYAPSNLIKIDAKINGDERVFYMLNDSIHLIEGTLYSPYALPPSLTEKHSSSIKEIAAKNKRELDDYKTTQKEFKQSVLNPVSHKYKQENNTDKLSKAETKLTLPAKNSIVKQDDKRVIFERTQDLEFIEIGESEAPLVYVYFDFNCSGCQKAKRELQKHTDSGMLRVRYIPVGVITEESAVKASLAMIPDDNTNRLALFDFFNDRGEVKTLLDQKVPEEKFKQGQSRVRKANTAFFGLPKTLTPTFVFESDDVIHITNPISSRSIENLVLQLNK